MAANLTHNINELIGARIRTLREAMDLTQRDLANKLGVSQHKIHMMEQGGSRVLVSDLFQVAQALGVQPLELAKDIPPLADVRMFLKITYADLAEESVLALDEMENLIKWAERRWRIKTNMPYRPMYYQGPSTLPQEFHQEWFNPTSTNTPFLYIKFREEGFLGRFFEQEIIPANSPLEYDRPAPQNSILWETEDLVRQFLQEQGYCWRYYPGKIHYDEYCSPEHKAEIEAQRRP